MIEFAKLIETLDSTNKTNDKLKGLEEFFHAAPDADKVWAVALFSGKRPKRTINVTLLAQWACELAAIPGWLFAECYNATGDLSEAITLVLPFPVTSSGNTLDEWMRLIAALGSQEQEIRERVIKDSLLSLTYYERFILVKLITGNFRIGVSARMMIKALATATGITTEELSHRLSGSWDPFTITWTELISAEHATHESKPYPFYLAHALEDLSVLGDLNEWAAEWKWDGIRGQLIIRNGNVYLWSRGEELVSGQFPEIIDAAKKFPVNAVIDGEILPFKDSKPMPFAQLQKRLGRKTLSKKLAEEVPVVFYSYDLLELYGEDIRQQPYVERKKQLMELLEEQKSNIIIPAPVVSFKDQQELSMLRESAREHISEGLMLKRKQSPYGTGRKRGDWWKWKIDPLTIDAVLIYAQPGSGRRASLYTDYTFGIWKDGQLVPVAKAYSGLTDEEIAKVDKFVRANTLEKFGPVRVVKPELVFELGFEGIARSTRHKSGIAVRFPRILRWRNDKPPAEADTVDTVMELLRKYGAGEE
jgi:DNA ligase 1